MIERAARCEFVGGRPDVALTLLRHADNLRAFGGDDA